MSYGNIKCPIHGEHGNVRDSGKTCGLCFAEGKTSSRQAAKTKVPVTRGDKNPEVASLRKRKIG